MVGKSDASQSVAAKGNLLEVIGVTRTFGSLVILDSVSLSLNAGEAAAVVGPNGSGKTTLLRCVVGADEPDGGQILLDGDELEETSPVVRAAVASALDDVAFFPDLSVLEHLLLYSWAHGAQSPDALVETVLDELELNHASDQLPATLSSGQQRRLALAACFVRPHRLLVLDEPEQRLDTAGRQWLINKLKAEKDAGVALLLASHDSELVDAVADKLVRVG
jgi:ABC-2 type transport system ATP-binding protein